MKFRLKHHQSHIFHSQNPHQFLHHRLNQEADDKSTFFIDKFSITGMEFTSFSFLKQYDKVFGLTATPGVGRELTHITHQHSSLSVFGIELNDDTKKNKKVKLVNDLTEEIGREKGSKIKHVSKHHYKIAEQAIKDIKAGRPVLIFSSVGLPAWIRRFKCYWEVLIKKYEASI